MPTQSASADSGTVSVIELKALVVSDSQKRSLRFFLVVACVGTLLPNSKVRREKRLKTLIITTFVKMSYNLSSDGSVNSRSQRIHIGK